MKQFMNDFKKNLNSHVGTYSKEELLSLLEELNAEYQDKYVPIETLQQVMWERDMALMQLEKLGYGLGEKMDGKEEFSLNDLDNIPVDRDIMDHIIDMKHQGYSQQAIQDYIDSIHRVSEYDER